MPCDFAAQTGFDTRVGAYCVLVENDAVLLVHLRTEQFEKGEWTLPGGGVDPLEKPEQAALREAREETGLEVELTGLLAVDSFTERPEDRHAEVDRSRALLGLRIVYTARQVGGELRAEVDGSTDLAAWVPLEDVSQLRRVELIDVALAAYTAAASSASTA